METNKIEIGKQRRSIKQKAGFRKVFGKLLIKLAKKKKIEDPNY